MTPCLHTLLSYQQYLCLNTGTDPGTCWILKIQAVESGLKLTLYVNVRARIQRGGGGMGYGPPLPPEKSQKNRVS